MEDSRPLVFGTDGWRDVIADGFTVANVRRAAAAYAEHLIERGATRVVVGHDTRFAGELFAGAVAAELAAHGLEVLLSDGYLPTPALSFAVKHFGAGGGVMLTASHNPPAYHGFKLKGPYGGTATDDIYRDVATRLRHQGATAREAAAPVERFDVRDAYYRALDGLLDVDLLSRSHGLLVHDAMGGAAGGWLSGYVASRELPLTVEEVRGEPHPLFYGVNPEPIAVNLQLTCERMRHSEALFAAATDGDGDRLGVVLPGGAFFDAHQIFAVLLDELTREGGEGTVVKTVTVSRIVERLAHARRQPVVETPVGFKYIVDAMLAGGVLVGGEESGGFGVAGHLPERDGIANALLLLQGVVRSGEPLAARFQALERETGWRHAYDRVDLHLNDPAFKDRVLDALCDPPSRVGRREVRSVERRDGIKLNLADDAWLLYRASGTEPLLRIYCEGPTPEEVRAILDAASAWLDALG